MHFLCVSCTLRMVFKIIQWNSSTMSSLTQNIAPRSGVHTSPRIFKTQPTKTQGSNSKLTTKSFTTPLTVGKKSKKEATGCLSTLSHSEVFAILFEPVQCVDAAQTIVEMAAKEGPSLAVLKDARSPMVRGFCDWDLDMCAGQNLLKRERKEIRSHSQKIFIFSLFSFFSF